MDPTLPSIDELLTVALKLEPSASIEGSYAVGWTVCVDGESSYFFAANKVVALFRLLVLAADNVVTQREKADSRIAQLEADTEHWESEAGYLREQLAERS